MTAGRWSVERVSGSAGELHALALPGEPEPSVWLLDVVQPAIVLGSAQPESLVDRTAAAAAGFAIARRRSGGGAVLVAPGDIVWVDVLVPVGDRLWNDDVAVASYWLGEVWAEVVRSLGHGARVHSGGLVADDLGRLICFGAVGPGEVQMETSSRGQGKVVGISQRRTREVARFQCACVLRWDPSPFQELMGPLTPAQMRRLHSAGGGLNVEADEVVDLFLGEISRV